MVARSICRVNVKIRAWKGWKRLWKGLNNTDRYVITSYKKKLLPSQIVSIIIEMWLLVLFSRVIRRTKIKNGSQLSTERGRNLLHAVYLTPIFPVVLGLPAADRNRAARFAKHDSFPRWGGRKGALVLFISWKVLCEISHRVFCIVDTTAQRSGAERSLLRACNVPN